MKSFLRKVVTLGVAGAISMSVVGCGGSDTSDSSSVDNSASAVEEVEEEEVTEEEVKEEESKEVSEDSTSVVVNAKNGEGEFVDMEVPFNPEKVAFLDYVSLDMCAALGILDNIEYMAVQDALPSYLAEYIGDDIANLGGLKTYQNEDATVYEDIAVFAPDLIFTSGRSAADYESFLEITTGMGDGGVVSSSIEYLPSTYESFLEINRRNASIFGMEDEIEEILGVYDGRLEELKEWGEGKTAMMAIFTGGAMNTLGNESRCSMIFNDLGFENLGNDVNESHGDSSSYEVLLALDPEYLFILDRDSAIGEEGASSAMELLDNELVHQTQAWQNGNIIELDPVIWYMVEGGVLAMDYMLEDLEAGMNK